MPLGGGHQLDDGVIERIVVPANIAESLTVCVEDASDLSTKLVESVIDMIDKVIKDSLCVL